jgi:hypothetical protein
LEESVNRELGPIRTAKEDTVGVRLECEDLEEREESVGGSEEERVVRELASIRKDTIRCTLQWPN